MPMTRIISLLSDNAGLNQIGASAYSVTSANALECWQSKGIGALCLKRPIYTVGKRTAGAAHAAGFSDVRVGAGDGARLAEKLIADTQAARISFSAATPLVYVAGRTRHPDFEARLFAEKLPFKLVELYDIEKISYSTDIFLQQLRDLEQGSVLLYSTKSAEIFFDRMERAGLFKKLKDLRFLCISESVANAVPLQFAGQTEVSAKPDEDNLLMLLG